MHVKHVETLGTQKYPAASGCPVLASGESVFMLRPPGVG